MAAPSHPHPLPRPLPRPRSLSRSRLRRSKAKAGPRPLPLSLPPPRSGSVPHPTARIPHSTPRILFITGTDTGVGKTLLTALLLAHLRNSNVPSLAIKPFCSGDRNDPNLLRDLQNGELSLDEINPFYFPEPLAPLVAARKHHRKITLQHTISHISRIAARLALPPIHQSIDPSLHHSHSAIRTPHSAIPNPPVLLIEGVGGLLVPLGKNYTVLDLIMRLNCEIIVVSRNQLGTINHTLLTIQALQTASPRFASLGTSEPGRLAIKVALMDCYSAIRNPQSAISSNHRVLSELLAPVPLVHIPFLGPNPNNPSCILKNVRRLRPQLTRLLA